VVQPNIQRLENSGRILVELPGVKEPERVRKLLQGTANLEFWTTYTAKDMAPYMVQANSIIAELLKQETAAQAPETTEQQATQSAGVDSTDIVSRMGEVQGPDSTAVAGNDAKNYPLLSILQISEYNTPVIGMAQSYDTARINKFLQMPQIRSVFPRDVKFMWGIKRSR